MKKTILLLFMLLGSLVAGAQTLRGDVNGDGAVDIADVSTLVGIILNDDSEGSDEEGDGYIMFSDTLYQLPVQDDETYFELPVVATKACDYDRVLAVEVIDSISNAIEDYHYKLKSNTVVIPAGKLVGNVEVCGFHKNIEVADSLGFALRLIGSDGAPWSSYGTEANVLLQKADWP
jgi:hypothetical protein